MQDRRRIPGKPTGPTRQTSIAQVADAQTHYLPKVRIRHGRVEHTPTEIIRHGIIGCSDCHDSPANHAPPPPPARFEAYPQVVRTAKQIMSRRAGTEGVPPDDQKEKHDELSGRGRDARKYESMQVGEFGMDDHMAKDSWPSTCKVIANNWLAPGSKQPFAGVKQRIVVSAEKGQHQRPGNYHLQEHRQVPKASPESPGTLADGEAP